MLQDHGTVIAQFTIISSIDLENEIDARNYIKLNIAYKNTYL